jgi:Arc/MetJ-type ribon-helix-helix transcriptional regulator
MAETKLVNFDCPLKLLEDFDEMVASGEFDNRAAALRVAMRDLIKKSKKNRVKEA